MNEIFLVANILCFSVQTIAIKQIKTDKPAENTRYTALFCLAGGFPLCLWCLITGAVSVQTLLWGLLFGLLYAAAMNSYSYAMKIGPMSYTAFIFSGNMLPPILFSVLLWKEPVSLPALAGILLFFVSFYFVGVLGRDKKEDRKGSGKWLFFSFLSVLLSGCASTVLKAHQIAVHGGEAVGLIGFGLLFAGLVSLRVSAVMPHGVSGDFKIGLQKNIIPVFCAGLTTAAGNVLFGYLSSRVAGPYLFPVLAGGNLLLVMLVSVFFLKEKINRNGWIGILMGILAVLVINQ